MESSGTKKHLGKLLKKRQHTQEATWTWQEGQDLGSGESREVCVG